MRPPGTSANRQGALREADYLRIGPPTVLSYGVGVDSAARLPELVSYGRAPDLVLTADLGAEKPETSEYLAMMGEWRDARGIEHHVVRYVTKRFKNHPPYEDLAGSLLTDGCVPSISFGRHFRSSGPA